MPVRPRTRRRSFASVLFYPLFLVSVAVALFVGWAVATERLDVSGLFGAREAHAAERSREGMVALPLTTREIPAYTRIRREDYWNASDGEFATWWMPAEQVTEDLVTYADLTKLNGRVLRRDKGRGYVFRWSDFLPEGSRDGLSAGVPPGKRGLWIATDKVRGLADLSRGDRFDILATTEFERSRRGRSSLPGVLGAEREFARETAGEARTARVDVLVQSGRVVRPMRTRAVPVSNTSVLRGQTTQGVPVQEVFVAVGADELAPLTRALALELDLQAAVRSGRPGEDPDASTPDLPSGSADAADDDAGPSMAFVETLIDGRRTVVPVMRAEAAPGDGGRDGALLDDGGGGR